MSQPTSILADIPFSLLELAPMRQGSTVGETLHNSLQYAKEADRLGFGLPCALYGGWLRHPSVLSTQNHNCPAQNWDDISSYKNLPRPQLITTRGENVKTFYRYAPEPPKLA